MECLHKTDEIALETIREGRNSAILIAGDLNCSEEELRQKMECCHMLDAYSDKERTRVQLGKWSTLDYIMTNSIITRNV